MLAYSAESTLNGCEARWFGQVVEAVARTEVRRAAVGRLHVRPSVHGRFAPSQNRTTWRR